MILGYLDSEDRAYELNFATLRMRIREEAVPGGGSQVVFAQSEGKASRAYRVLAEVSATASVAMDYGGDLVPLLRPVAGRLLRLEKSVLFLAEPASRDPGEPSFFLVNVGAMPSAVQHFFEEREGREIVSIPDDEVLRVSADKDGVTVSVSAAALALPKEALAYAVRFGPPDRVGPVLAGLPSSPRR